MRLFREDDTVSWEGGKIRLADVGAPVAICTKLGSIVDLSPQARTVFEHVGIEVRAFPFPLPSQLWDEFSAVPEGEAIEWRGTGEASLGCTRYSLGSAHAIVLMREVSAKRRELSRRLHKQRLESTGRMVASIAHDVRTALASILYNSDFLSGAVHDIAQKDVVEITKEIHDASRRLQGICNGLLGYAKLGPPVADDYPLSEVVSRVCSLVRPLYRERNHELRSHVLPGAAAVRGNSMQIDQILVNLLVNAAQSSNAPLHVVLECSPGPARANAAPMVRISVTDDGPGVPESLREAIFDPFFTTHADGSGLGLTTAREAAREMGGDLILEPSSRGACFVALLPAAERRKTE
jgi:signal transduction histidine kinase